MRSLKRQWVLRLCMIVCVIGCTTGNIRAQQQAPDTILYNGKIVTVDNHEINGNLGTIAQAIAIRDRNIVAVGSNAEIRRMAASSTKSLDLKGRLVIPGFAATHDHPQDWNVLNPTIVKKVITDDMHIERFMNAPAKDVVRDFPRVLAEAVQVAKPGQWIRISLLFGPEYQWGDEIMALFGKQIDKQMLDLMAPNNPVEIKGGFTGMLINQQGIEAVKKFYGDQWDKFLFPPFVIDMFISEEAFEKSGFCGVCYRYVEQDVLFEPAALAEIYRLGLSWTTALGVTTNATSLYTGGAIRAFSTLDREKEMAMRLAWGWFWPFRNDLFFDPYFVQAQVSREGTGSDHLWVHGMTPAMGMNCSKLPGITPEVKNRELPCWYNDPVVSRALYEYVKAGGRLAGDHQVGDGEVDLVLDIIEKASKDGGMTLDQIRAKRHVTEHMSMYPRPDQIPRLKKLGMMTSGFDINFFEGAADKVLKNYGERGVLQIQPRRSLYDAGIMNSFEIDRPLAEYTNLGYFQVLHSAITKKNREGKVLAPQEAITREEALKSATLWGGFGVLREKMLGSLEPGKWADLLVLDRDYLTVPVDDIPKIHVLMTMVGGTPVHLVPSLAREWNQQPVGAQIDLGGPASQW